MVKNYSSGRVPIGPVRRDDLRTTLALGGGGELRCRQTALHDQVCTLNTLNMRLTVLSNK